MNDSAPMDFINTLIDVLESLFQTKTVIDPALNGKLDTSYYQSSYGGLPSAKDRSSAAHRLETGNSADEQKSMDFLAQIDPDYDPSDPYGTGSSFDTSLVEKIMRNVSDMLSAAKKIGGDAESLREFLEAIKDFVTSVVNLVSNTIAFMQQIVARVAELVGGAVYERLLLNGYLVYHIPNRTDYETGKSLAGMSYSQAGLSYDPGDVHFTYPGSDMMQIIQAIASGGGETQKSFDGAELEYILWGVNSEAANQAMHFSALYLMRLLLNLPGILTNKEVSSLAAAANVFAPIVYIVYIFAEPLCLRISKSLHLSKAVRGILYAIPVQLAREHLILPLGSPSIKNSFKVLLLGMAFFPFSVTFQSMLQTLSQILSCDSPD